MIYLIYLTPVWVYYFCRHEQAKHFTMKAVLRACFTLLFMLLVAGATDAMAQSSTTVPDTTDSGIIIAPGTGQVNVPANANLANPANTAAAPVLTPQEVNALTQLLNDYRTQLQNTNPTDPRYAKLEDAILRLENQLNQQ